MSSKSSLLLILLTMIVLSLIKGTSSQAVAQCSSQSRGRRCPDNWIPVGADMCILIQISRTGYHKAKRACKNYMGSLLSADDIEEVAKKCISERLKDIESAFRIEYIWASHRCPRLKPALYLNTTGAYPECRYDGNPYPYVCKVHLQNYEWPSIKSLALTVNGENEHNMSKESSVTVTRGDMLTFTCVGSGEPEPYVTLSGRMGHVKPVTQSENVTQTVRATACGLWDVLTCRAQQIFGVEITTNGVEVRVLCPPNCPTEITVTNQGVGNISLSWKPIFDEGPNQSFHVFYSNDNVTWTKVDVSANETRAGDMNMTADIDGLQRNTGYFFRVVPPNQDRPIRTNSYDICTDTMYATTLKNSGSSGVTHISTVYGTHPTHIAGLIVLFIVDCF